MTNKEKQAEIASIEIETTIFDDKNDKFASMIQSTLDELNTVKKRKDLTKEDLEKIYDLDSEVSKQVIRLKKSKLVSNNHKKRLNTLNSEMQIIAEQNKISTHFMKLKKTHEFKKYCFLAITLIIPIIITIYLFNHKQTGELLSVSNYLSLAPLIFIELVLYRAYSHHNNLSEHYEHREAVAISVIRVSETYFGKNDIFDEIQDKDKFREFGLDTYNNLYEPIKKEKNNDKELIKVARNLIKKFDNKY